MPSYTLSGPTLGTKGSQSAPFTLTPSGTVTDTVELMDGVNGGTFFNSIGAPITSLAWSASSVATTFAYQASIVGPVPIEAVSLNGYAMGSHNHWNRNVR
jgi:hypothetical protein